VDLRKNVRTTRSLEEWSLSLGKGKTAGAGRRVDWGALSVNRCLDRISGPQGKRHRGYRSGAVAAYAGAGSDCDKRAVYMAGGGAGIESGKSFGTRGSQIGRVRR